LDDCASVCPEVLCADQEVQALRELLKQTDVPPAKDRSVVEAETGKLVPHPFAYRPIEIAVCRKMQRK
jgi:hypothetical protein